MILIVIFVDQKGGLPFWIFWGIIALWVLWEILLFPFVWRSYDARSTHPMVGKHGVAVDRLAPSGYIQVHGELWQAELTKGCRPVDSSETVRVKEVRGIKLIVEPVKE